MFVRASLFEAAGKMSGMDLPQVAADAEKNATRKRKMRGEEGGEAGCGVDWQETAAELSPEQEHEVHASSNVYASCNCLFCRWIIGMKSIGGPAVGGEDHWRGK